MQKKRKVIFTKVIEKRLTAFGDDGRHISHALKACGLPPLIADLTIVKAFEKEAIVLSIILHDYRNPRGERKYFLSGRIISGKKSARRKRKKFLNFADMIAVKRR